MGAATVQVAMAQRLLENDAALAKSVIANANLRYPNKEAFFADIDQFMSDKDLVTYNEDSIAVQL